VTDSQAFERNEAILEEDFSSEVSAHFVGFVILSLLMIPERE